MSGELELVKPLTKDVNLDSCHVTLEEVSAKTA